MAVSDDQAREMLGEALKSIDDYYKERGIFQDRFGFGKKPAIVVVDFANGWTDEAYAGGTARLDGPVEATRQLLDVARPLGIPIAYTTSPYRPEAAEQPFKSAADPSPGFREWDANAVKIDERVAPAPGELVIEKEAASAFAGTAFTAWLIQHQVDTVLITGCSTSACIRATATDAKSCNFKPVIVEECVGDRSAVAHVFTLADIQARFSDVVSLPATIDYLKSLPGN